MDTEITGMGCRGFLNDFISSHLFISLSSEKGKNIYKKTRATESSVLKKKCFDSPQDAK